MNGAARPAAAKLSHMRLGEISRMDCDHVEESGFTFRIAETSKSCNVFRSNVHSERISEIRCAS